MKTHPLTISLKSTADNVYGTDRSAKSTEASLDPEETTISAIEPKGSVCPNLLCPDLTHGGILWKRLDLHLKACVKNCPQSVEQTQPKSEQRVPLVSNTQSKRKKCPNTLCPDPTHSGELWKRLYLHYKACIKNHPPNFNSNLNFMNIHINLVCTCRETKFSFR